jgi:hypothetical protein
MLMIMKVIAASCNEKASLTGKLALSCEPNLLRTGNFYSANIPVPAKLDYFPALFGGDPNHLFGGCSLCRTRLPLPQPAPFLFQPPARHPGLPPELPHYMEACSLPCVRATFVTVMQSVERQTRGTTQPLALTHGKVVDGAIVRQSLQRKR